MKHEVMAGETIEQAAFDMISNADDYREDITVNFNGIELIAHPLLWKAPGDYLRQRDSAGLRAREIVHYYMTECERRHQAYLVSDEYAQSVAAAKKAQAERETALADASALAPKQMTTREGMADEWAKTVARNGDPYGAATIRYAETWARLMEARVASGDSVAGCASATSRVANSEGISGAMYGYAVAILSRVWIRGEELRRWHNLDAQIKNEGERANESGGVLNPTLLVMGE